MRPLALVLATLAFSPLAAARPEGGARELLFVAAEDANVLAVVDPATSRIVRRIRVAAGPHNVAARGRFVLVTSPPAGVVTVVSARTLRVLRVFRGLAYPHDVEIAGQWAWVTEERGDRVTIIDLARLRIAGRVRVPSRPHDLAPGDGWAWVTHSPRARELTLVVGPTRPRVARRIAAGGAAHDIAVRPDRGRVFLTYWNSGVVAQVDAAPARPRAVFRRRVGTLTHHVQLDTSPERLWVTDHVGGRVLLLSSLDGRVRRTWRGCAGAHHIAPFGGNRAAIACHDSGELLVVETETGRQRSIHVAHGLHGVAAAIVP